MKCRQGEIIYLSTPEDEAQAGWPHPLRVFANVSALPAGMRLSLLRTREPINSNSEENDPENVDKQSEGLRLSRSPGELCKGKAVSVVENSLLVRVIEKFTHAQENESEGAEKGIVVFHSDRRDGDDGAGSNHSLVPLVQQLEIRNAGQLSAPPDAPSHNGRFLTARNRIASCPNFPECGCFEGCAGDMTPSRLSPGEWILITCIIAATLIAAWIVLSQGGGHG